jgi:hypothetical protein
VFEAVKAEAAEIPAEDSTLAEVGVAVKAVIEVDWARLSIAPYSPMVHVLDP